MLSNKIDLLTKDNNFNLSYIIYKYSSVLCRMPAEIVLNSRLDHNSFFVCFLKIWLVVKYGMRYGTFVPCFRFAKILLLTWTEEKCFYKRDYPHELIVLFGVLDPCHYEFPAILH